MSLVQLCICPLEVQSWGTSFHFLQWSSHHVALSFRNKVMQKAFGVMHSRTPWKICRWWGSCTRSPGRWALTSTSNALLTPVPPVLLSRRRCLQKKWVCTSVRGSISQLCQVLRRRFGSAERWEVSGHPVKGRSCSSGLEGDPWLRLVEPILTSAGEEFRRPCWARMGQRSPIGLRLPILCVLSPEEKRFPFFQLRAASSKPFASGRVVFWGWVFICPPWSRHRSSAHKVLCHGQSKTDTQIETERRKKKMKGVTQIRKP